MRERYLWLAARDRKRARTDLLMGRFFLALFVANAAVVIWQLSTGKPPVSLIVAVVIAAQYVIVRRSLRRLTTSADRYEQLAKQARW